MRQQRYEYRHRGATVSIHAPWEGCDDGHVEDDAGVGAVSIHAPWEGCDAKYARSASPRLTVSIHAPWEGCDYRFNPFRLLAYQFQFTHPGKGATQRDKNRSELCRVSIHAPWEGCDHRGGEETQAKGSFNSRTLGRVRRHVAFSFLPEDVSIHAPWEGCDGPQGKVGQRGECFNSRTLGRVRHVHNLTSNYPREFQFTHPGKGATIAGVSSQVLSGVSIHAPWEGCDAQEDRQSSPH